MDMPQYIPDPGAEEAALLEILDCLDELTAETEDIEPADEVPPGYMKASEIRSRIGELAREYFEGGESS